jgi:MFS family permease
VTLPTRDVPETASARGRARRPWWIPSFLGRVPAEATEHQVRLLGVIALALLFEHYDMSMLGSAAKYIRESFDLPQSDLGRLMGLVRLGALPAVFLVAMADRIGRRRLFLVSVVGGSLATLLTAFAASVEHFVAIQVAARTFLIAGSASAFVIVAEEFPAQHRGWAIGILGALGSVGFGLGAALFAAIDVLPYGWRALYAFGVLPLLLVPLFRREVRETRRFEEHRAAQAGSASVAWWRPFLTLARRYPARMLAIAAIGALASAGYSTAHGLLGDYVQTDHDWSPGQYSLMFVVGGAVGIVGNTVVGRFADRAGRRRAGLYVLGAFPFLALAFYQGSGWVLPATWTLLVFATTGGNTIVRALVTELFPTSSRSTATGSLTLFETLGAVGGLFLVYAFTPAGESNAPVTSAVVFLTLLAASLVLLLPETAKRELEEIS